jgi:hypothetical protein
LKLKKAELKEAGMWFDLTLILVALIPLLLTKPVRVRNLPPAAR